MNEKIGQLIRKYREETGITSTELAKNVGVSQGTISNIENGKSSKRATTLEIIKQIIAMLKIPIDNDIKAYLNIHNDPIQHEKSSSPDKAFIHGVEVITSLVGRVSQVKMTIESQLSETIILDELSPSERNKMKSLFIFESDIIVNTIADYFENNDELDKLIAENLNKEFKDLMNTYRKETIKDGI